jgi:NAD(P)H-dependent flavin oxidoreductase YrpB (nitropropane dioxygenase family)
MGAIGTPELIGAVSRAGALGMVSTAGMSADQVTSMLDAVLDVAEGPSAQMCSCRSPTRLSSRPPLRGSESSTSTTAHRTVR